MALMEINWRPERGQLRTFGAGCVVALGIIGAVIFVRHNVLGWHLSVDAAKTTAFALWGAGLLAGGLAIIWPGGLRPLYLLLTIVTLPIGYVLSHVVMAILFYGVLMPAGVALRLLGKDPMNRKLMPDAKTYWTPREQVRDAGRYYRQY